MPTPRRQAQGSPAAAVLFERMWAELVELVGTAATAALLRRALKRALARAPAARLPAVERAGLEYACTTPESWQDPSCGEAVEELRRLVREDLGPLFRQLTGSVIARRLAQVPELVDAGIVDVGEVA